MYTEFERWRDEIYCGGYEMPTEHIEAVIGVKYELYDNVNDEIVRTEICTEANKAEIEKSLNESFEVNDMWWWRKVQNV